MADLPARQREALLLTRFQGMTHQEAAETMGCSPRTVNNHLVRALRALRERVDEYAEIEGSDR
jgi:RNA polymerase sigma-70 factor (ECF subfamily)